METSAARPLGASNPPPSEGSARWDRLLLGLAIAAVALLARWSPNEPPLAFAPRQDALEYVAGAQSIVQEGTYLLRVGPHRVRPRYAPGFSLLLAGALAAGLPPPALWRVAALAGAGLAALVALLASWLARALAPVDGRAGTRVTGWVAGAVAGLTWAFSPVAARVGGAVMSDGSAALAGLASLLLLAAALLGEPRRRLAKAAAAGLLWGVVAVTRPVAGALLLPPMAVLAWTALRRPPRGPLLRALAAAAAGALVAPLVVSLVLIHSGLPPLPWSGYRFWMPAQFDSVRGPFMLRSALEGRAGLGEGGAPLSNLQLGIRALLGLTGIRRTHQAGFVWPLLGWIAGALLFRTARSRRPALAAASPLAAAFLAWTAAHLLVFSLYVYSGGRFYLPVLATLAALFGAGTGVALSRLAPVRRVGLGGAVALLAVLASGIPGPTRSGEYTPPPLERALPRRVPRWLGLDDATRAQGTMPFDPVFAQALGLLGPEAVAEVHEWGKLPATWHVQQLVKLGAVPASEMAAAQPR